MINTRIQHKSKQGFTLIELLVVIAIISLLSSIVLASLNSARSKARDAARMTALRQIQSAVELYAADNGGNYPGYIFGINTFTRSVGTVAEIGSPPSKCGYGAPGTPGAGNPSYPPGIWCKLETVLSPYIAELPPSGGGMPPFYYFIYKVPSTSLIYNPNGIRTYGLGVFLENANSTSKNDGGWSDTMYEIGELPSYCASQGAFWYSWSAVPCKCATYYSVGCVY